MAMKKLMLIIGIVMCAFVIYAQQAGVLDITFDYDGKLIDTVDGFDTRISAILSQPDGKIIAGGTTQDGFNYQFVLARYNNDGSHDLTFGTNGIVKHNFATTNVDSRLWALDFQSDGKIIAAGQTYTSLNNYDFVVARFKANGAVDNSFGTNGCTYIHFRDIDDGRAMKVGPGDKIYIGGNASLNNTRDVGIARLNSDGSIDSTFNGTGKLTIDYGGMEFCTAVAIQNDDKLIIAAVGMSHQLLIRLGQDGAFDTSFNHTGIVIADTVGAIYALELQSDGKILAGGGRGGGFDVDFCLGRFNADGSLDSSFPPILDYIRSGRDIITNIKVQQDGKILAAGYSGIFNSSTGEDFALACYNSDGTRDFTFGNNGVVLTDFTNNADWAATMAIQPDYKIVLGGSGFTSGRFHFALARYQSNFVGIEENFKEELLLIYPNPSNSAITIECTRVLKQIIISTAVGRQIKSITNIQLSIINIDVSDLSAGIYFFNCITEKGAEMVKVVKVEN
jgi:uncharacterized delta-60 repeat protein